MTDIPGLLATIERLEATYTDLKSLLPALAEELGTTVTGAYVAWTTATEWEDRARRQHEENAELAFWYHIDPFSLTDDQRAGLLGNLPRVKAQGQLHSGNYNPTDWRGMYDLVLLATGDERAALQARAQAAEAGMGRGR